MYNHIEFCNSSQRDMVYTLHWSHSHDPQYSTYRGSGDETNLTPTGNVCVRNASCTVGDLHLGREMWFNDCSCIDLPMKSEVGRKFNS